MIARALLALLLACLALPAAAMPMMHEAAHPAPAAQVPHQGHHTPLPAQPDMAAAHDCIGCIPPNYGLSRIATPVGFLLSLDHAQTIAPLSVAPHSAPDTPPPRAPS